MLGKAVFVSSWIEEAGPRCFQLMEADSAADLRGWMEAWADLVEFEVVPVQDSQTFWSNYDVPNR